jgi:hypothetical protein
MIGTLLATALIAGIATTPTRARDDDTTFEAPIIGSVPGAFVGGVPSGGAPWKVAKGEVKLENSGRLTVQVRGLLLVTNNTTGPVAEVVASLVCFGSGGTVTPPFGATGTPVGLSAAGNADIQDVLTLPATCPAPVVLIRIFSTSTQAPGAFIALSGIMG